MRASGCEVIVEACDVAVELPAQTSLLDLLDLYLFDLDAF